MQLNLKHIQSQKSVYVKVEYSFQWRFTPSLSSHNVYSSPRFNFPKEKKKFQAHHGECKGKTDKAYIVITFSRLIS